MELRRFFSSALFFFIASAACGQAVATAGRPLDLTFYSGMMSEHPGFGRQSAIGHLYAVDANFCPCRGFVHSIELRGSQASNPALSEKTLLMGYRMLHTFSRLEAAVNLSGGRRQYSFTGDGYVAADGKTAYTKLATTVWSAGLTGMWRLRENTSLRIDGQLQQVPNPLTSGLPLGSTFSLGVEFHAPARHHGFIE